MVLNRSLAAASAVLAAGLAFAAIAAGAQPSAAAVTCTNPASGVSWLINVDYAKGTVDSYPASISDKEISWRNVKESANYTLDRKSGKLTAIYPSSTGGYFLFDHCRLEN